MNKIPIVIFLLSLSYLFDFNLNELGIMVSYK